MMRQDSDGYEYEYNLFELAHCSMDPPPRYALFSLLFPIENEQEGDDIMSALLNFHFTHTHEWTKGEECVYAPGFVRGEDWQAFAKAYKSFLDKYNAQS